MDSATTRAPEISTSSPAWSARHTPAGSPTSLTNCSGRLLCIRETRTHRRYERPTSPRESLRLEGRLETGGAVGAEERAPSLALQSGADGAWCAGLYREKTEMP